MDDELKKEIREAVQEAFGTGIGDGRYIDVSRIPLICQSIVGINNTLTSIEKKMDEKLVTQDQFWPVKTIVYSLVGIALTSVAGAVIALVVQS